MNPREARDLARAANIASNRAARETRATWRGVVQSINPDGSAQVELNNGHTIKVASSNLFAFAEDQSVTMLRAGNIFEVLGPSGYGGGRGAPS